LLLLLQVSRLHVQSYQTAMWLLSPYVHTDLRACGAGMAHMWLSFVADRLLSQTVQRVVGVTVCNLSCPASRSGSGWV